MKELKKIIDYFLVEESLEKKIAGVGTIKKIIGNVYVLNPIIVEIEGMGLIIKENKVKSINLVFKNPILFKELQEELSQEYVFRFNHYDEESVITMDYKGIKVRLVKSGYLDEQINKNETFKRFEIQLF